MSLNPTGGIPNWNYTKADKPGYTAPDANGQQSIIGTVVSLQEVQGRKWRADGQLGAPDTWDDGKPKMNIRMGMAKPDGSLVTFTFGKAGKEARAGKKPSVHMDLFNLAGGQDMMQLIGKTIQLTTWPSNPTTGQTWGNGNPRLFNVQEVQAGPFQLTSPLPNELTVAEVYCDEGVTGGQPVAQPVAPAPSAVSVPVVPVAGVQPSGVYPAPTAQMMGAAAPAAVVQPAAPAGMDPSVAANLNAMGATNVQPVAEDVYQDEIPF